MNPLIMAYWHATRGGGFSGIVSFTRYGSGQELMDSGDSSHLLETTGAKNVHLHHRLPYSMDALLTIPSNVYTGD